jgi:allophanate hydrolase
MAIGRVTLIDATSVSGFLVEPAALENAPDISHLGGWRAYLAAPAGSAVQS